MENDKIENLGRRIDRLHNTTKNITYDIKKQYAMITVCLCGMALDSFALYFIVAHMRPSALGRIMFFLAVGVDILVAGDFKNRVKNIRDSRKQRVDCARKLESLTKQYNEMRSQLANLNKPLRQI